MRLVGCAGLQSQCEVTMPESRVAEAAAEDTDEYVRMFASVALARIDQLEASPQTSFAKTWGVNPDPEPVRRALLEYDLARMGSAQIGKPAPDFALVDTNEKTWRLTELKGREGVVFVFLFGE